MAHDSDIDDRGKLLCRKEAARYLTALGLVIAPQTLARKYHEGTGPLCTHVGVRAMYWQAHLDAYFTAQVSDAAAGSPTSKTRMKRAAVDPTPPRQAMASAPSNQAPKEEVSDPAVSPPQSLAPLPVTTTPVATVAPPPPAKPTKRKKPVASAPLNQQELPF